jgi:hypothetical protein
LLTPGWPPYSGLRSRRGTARAPLTARLCVRRYGAAAGGQMRQGMAGRREGRIPHSSSVCGSYPPRSAAVRRRPVGAKPIRRHHGARELPIAKTFRRGPDVAPFIQQSSKRQQVASTSQKRPNGGCRTTIVESRQTKVLPGGRVVHRSARPDRSGRAGGGTDRAGHPITAAYVNSASSGAERTVCHGLTRR